MRVAYRAESALGAEAKLEALARDLDRIHPVRPSRCAAATEFQRRRGHSQGACRRIAGPDSGRNLSRSAVLPRLVAGENS